MITKGKRPTISDIAKATGYSKTAVSFAFNFPERISKETREKILKTAKELNFTPDPVARNFSRGKYMTIGFLLPQRLETSLSNPYTQDVIKGIGCICEEHGYTLTLIPPLHSSISEAIKNATVDGLIAMGFFFNKTINEAFALRNLPAVVIDGIGDNDMVSVGIDDIAASELAMNKAIECGHRDIAIITLPDDAYAFSTPEEATTICKKRKLGYLNSMIRHGLDEHSATIESCKATLEDGKETAKRILAKKKPSCIICMSDIVALGVISELKEQGLSVPNDISVIGFDGIIDSNLAGFELTTISQSAIEKGMLSANLIFQMLKGNAVKKQNHIGYRFIEGSTLKKKEG